MRGLSALKEEDLIRIGTYRSSQNYHPRRISYFELVRRGVLCYAVFFTPNTCSRVKYAG